MFIFPKTTTEQWALTGKILAALVMLLFLAAGVSEYADGVAEERLRQTVPAEKLKVAIQGRTLLEAIYRRPLADTTGRQVAAGIYDVWIDSLEADVEASGVDILP